MIKQQLKERSAEIVLFDRPIVLFFCDDRMKNNFGGQIGRLELIMPEQRNGVMDIRRSRIGIFIAQNHAHNVGNGEMECCDAPPYPFFHVSTNQTVEMKIQS